ncbi:NADPH-dependent FMN reductase [Pedobacter glucosidilyticus]|uniref:NADPH-dependent FMN reductase n=1 Tax=Pedobacter glucosidilyticus TaxID=1122941 RepID=UPI000422A240|nr:NAD(P)H-dependent oxidoreductase [Pedobacter glucosidilyticus]
MKEQQKNNQQEPLRFLVFSASLRADSLNTQLIKLAAEVITKNGGIVDYANMSEFDCPSFNQDLEVNDFHPAGAQAFRKRILANDAFIISSPEYNGSIPGLLKNSIDWVSRFRPQPFQQQHGLLMSASPGMAGGNHGLWSLRIPLEKLGVHIFPAMFSLSKAHEAFSPEGKITDENLTKKLEDHLINFMNTVEASKNYPAMKLKFLGE